MSVSYLLGLTVLMHSPSAEARSVRLGRGVYEIEQSKGARAKARAKAREASFLSRPACVRWRPDRDTNFRKKPLRRRVVLMPGSPGLSKYFRSLMR